MRIWIRMSQRAVCASIPLQIRVVSIVLFLCIFLPAIGCGQRIEPEFFVYQGAFRLPEGSNGSDWNFSATAMTFIPGGDPSGPDDGFPGSIIACGHDQQMMLSEILIPVPVISPEKNPEDLNTAETLQPFYDIRTAAYSFIDPYNIPVLGIEYLPEATDLSAGKLHFCWGQHIQYGEPSHGFCQTTLDQPQTAGPWHLGNHNNYTTNDYLFEVDPVWADAYAPGQRLATGRFREGVWSGYGPALYVYAPDSLESNGTLEAITPLLLYGEDDPALGEIVVSEEMRMDEYHLADDWSGGAWLSAYEYSAVIFAGTKGLGNGWYGFSDGTVWPYEGPYPPVPPVPHDSRGYWADSIGAEILFYDPEDLGRVTNGTMQPYEPQPYAALDLVPYLYNPGYDYWRGKRHLLGACCFDRENGIVYLAERIADEDKSLIHVWRIETPTQTGRSGDSKIQTFFLESYPNPFNAGTVIRYTLSSESAVRLCVYDLRGREVRMLVSNKMQSGGSHSIFWEGESSQGQPLPSDVYLLVLNASQMRQTIKLTLLK